ncbi:MAG: hypothetical protein ABF284_01650, partial [Polaribacter sp.]
MIKSKQNVLLILACLFIRTNWSWVCLFKVALLTSFSLVMLYYKTKKNQQQRVTGFSRGGRIRTCDLHAFSVTL